MGKYIEVSIRYDKMKEDGNVAKVSEKYLVDTVTLSDAENVVVEAMKPHISGEFYATSAKHTRIEEIIGVKDNGKYWNVKVAFITLDEKSGREKRTIMQILVGADSLIEAYEMFQNHMEGSMADYVIVGISESPYLDYFPYKYE